MLDRMTPSKAKAQPLDKCRVFGSSDVDETRAHVARLYCDHRLSPTSQGAQLQAWQNAVTIKQSCLATMGYGAEVQIDPGKLQNFYLLMLPYAGQALVDAGGRTVQASPTLGSLLSPDDLVTMRWSPDCAKYMVRIDREALEQHVAALLGHPLRRPLNFRLAIPREGLGAEWWRLTELLVGLVECQDRAHPQSLAIEQLEQALLLSLIEGQEHSYSDVLRDRDRSIAPRHVRLVEHYIEEHAADPITIEHLVAVSGVSGRALFDGFKRFRNTSPMAHLRACRMRRVREALLKPTPDTTVSRLAQDWGFFELGRFAGQYRKLYGETPSETLRRVR